MELRYSRNIPSISEKQQELLAKSHVLIAGCGGIGGYVAEYLARIGVGKITLADYDSFDKTNLNRQIYAREDNIGKTKVTEIKEHLSKVNSLTEVEIWMSRLRQSTTASALSGKDLVIDCLDNLEDRLMLEEACGERGIMMIHGALAGWQYQVMTVTPGKGSLKKFYDNNVSSSTKSTLAFVPAVCASLQVAEAVRVLCGEEPALGDRILIGDMKTMSSSIRNPEEKIFEDREIEITVSKYNNKGKFNVPQHSTVRELLEAVELAGENLFVMRNGQYVMPDTFDEPILEEGDLIEFRRAAALNG